MKRILSFILICLISLSLSASDRTFALVLSGGGAKGIALIPVLEELDRRGLYPDYVVGTSIGALIGAFYSAGYSGEEIRDLIADEDLMSLFMSFYSRSGKRLLEGGEETPLTNILTLDFSNNNVGASNGIIDDQYVAAFLRKNLIKVLNIKDFDELSIPYRAIGTDLLTGEEVVFSEGSLYDAMRGSMAIPIVFTPGISEDGRYILDGGMVNNIPADVARDLGADVVLAVDLNDVMNRHNDGMIYNDVETLTGMIFQVLDLVTTPNAAERYEYADYVIVPDVATVGALDFNRAEEIYESGLEAVKESSAVFDELERQLGRSEERPAPYSEREPFVIRNIRYEGLQEYRVFFNTFINRIADYRTAEALEELLQYIKSEEGFKSIGYDIDGESITIRHEDFRALSSSVSLGLNFDLGVKSGIESSKTLFYFMPHVSVVFDIGLPERYGTFFAGLDYKDYVALFASYYYDLGNSFSLFASLKSGVGDISMLSVADRIDRMDTTDFILSLNGGVAYDFMKNFHMELFADMDVISLGSLKSCDSLINDRDRMAFFVPRLHFNMKYRGYTARMLHSPGIDIDMDASIYLKAPLMYTLSLSFESVIPSFINGTRFFFNGEATTLRGNEYIGSSYRTNRSGYLTRDYVFIEAGGRIILTPSIFLDVSFFSEGYETRSYKGRFWPPDYSLVPFSMINDYSVGFALSVSHRSKIGDLSLDIAITHHGTFSLGVSLK